MQVFEQEPWNFPAPSVLTVGVFDGLHLGHQALIKHAISRAKEKGICSAVLTFREHPLAILAPPFCPKRLLYPDRKQQILAELGIDFLACVRFTRDFARQSPEEFVRNYLVSRCKTKGVVCGPDFTFGTNGSGTVETLRDLGEKFGFFVDVVEPCSVDNMFARSTIVRDLLFTGELDKVYRILTRPYELRGTVVPGHARGHKLGFPTANLDPTPQFVVPARGVYVCAVAGDRVPGVLPAMVNIGYNPTFGSDRLTIEAHILNFAGELRGTKLSLFFLKRLRDEQVFSGADALIRQLTRDREQTVSIWEEPGVKVMVGEVDRLLKGGTFASS